METKEETNEKKSKKSWFKTIVAGTSTVLGAVGDVALFTMKVSGAVILTAVAVGLLTKKDDNDNAE